MQTPTHIQQVQATQPHRVEVIEKALPDLQAHQVLVKSLYSGISHATELAVIQQTTPTFHKNWDKGLRCFTSNTSSKQYPAALGYESVGEVIAMGSQIRDLQLGDHIWLDAPHQTLHLFEPDKTPFIKLQQESDTYKALFLALTRVALAGVHDAHPQLGESVFVSGLGTVGLITVQLLLLAGVSSVYATDPIAERRAKAEQYGATTFSSGEDIAAHIKALSQGVDAAIERSGSSQALHDAIKVCKIGARVVTVATYRNSASQLFLGEEWHRNRITLISSMSVNHCPHRDTPLWNLDRLNTTALHLLRCEKIIVEDLITHRFSFQDADKAYQLIQQQPETTLKVILEY